MERVLLVASTGGHLAELRQWQQDVCTPADVVLWATFATEQSRSLLADEQVVILEDVLPRGYGALFRNIPRAMSLIRSFRPHRIVSTGSGIALAFLPLAPLVGARSAYVESAARTRGPSLTGRLLSFLPWVRMCTQYPGNASRRWKFEWSVFDRWEPLGELQVGAVDGPPRVLVTLGTLDFEFPRLVASIRATAPAGTSFIWQLGTTVPDAPLPGKILKTVGSAELERLAKECTAVISHAGVGSALLAFQCGFRPILVPRLKAFGEHVDDHQVEVARYLESRGLAICRNADELSPELFEMDYRLVPPT